MATLNPLSKQLKETVLTAPTVTKGKTGPLTPGRSTAKTVAKTVPKTNKFDLAREVYNNNLTLARKDVLLLFISECGMGKNYASTAYQMLKKQSEQ